MSISDEWQTPHWLFNELDKEFLFNVDICAQSHNTKCNYFLQDCLIGAWPNPLPTKHSDYDSFRGFMNPPYSTPYVFVEKAWEQSKEMLVVCLLKCDPSTRWWAIFWDYEKHQPKAGCKVRFLPKRIKFDPPATWKGKVTTPAFPSAVIIMDRR